MSRILRRTSGSYELAVELHDESGAPFTPTAGSVVVYDGSGAEVSAGVAQIATGGLTYALPVASAPNLDAYEAVWTADGQEVPTSFEIVGGFLFELHELRAHTPQAGLDSLTIWPTSALEDVREEAEDIIENGANIAFVPRGARFTTQADGDVTLPHLAIRRIVGITVDGTPLTTEELAAVTFAEWGLVSRPRGFSGTVAVHYEHGADYPPRAVRRAALDLAVDRALSAASGLPSRATGQNTELGFIRFTLAGRDGTTGIPSVDAVISQFGRSRTLVG